MTHGEIAVCEKWMNRLAVAKIEDKVPEQARPVRDAVVVPHRPRPAPATLPDAEATDAIVARIQEAVDDALGAQTARDIGVCAHDRVTDRYYSVNGRFRTESGSLATVFILVALLRELRRSGREMNDRQHRLADQMIRVGDGPAANTLFRQAGGRAALDRLSHDLGQARTQSSGRSWGRTITTPPDLVLLMDSLLDGTGGIGLTYEEREFVLELMSRVIPAQKWGVGAVPSEVDAQVKNGWMPMSSDAWRVNSFGHVIGWERDYTLAVMSTRNATMEEGVRRVNTVSRAVFAALG